MRADTGGWNNLYIIMINRPMSYFVGFYDFSHGFPTFSPNVSATSDLYPLPGRPEALWRMVWPWFMARVALGTSVMICTWAGVLLALSVAWLIDVDVTLWKINIDPENSIFLMETSLPTPTTARVYVNLPEGNFESVIYCSQDVQPVQPDPVIQSPQSRLDQRQSRVLIEVILCRMVPPSYKLVYKP